MTALFRKGERSNIVSAVRHMYTIHMKTCTKCKTEQQEVFFNKRTRGKNGLGSVCKGCTRAYCRSKGKPKRSPAYQVWNGMKKRCDYTKAINYKNYGGRGITYDPVWASYKIFWKDMGEGYKEGLTLDRKDNDGPYSKENCRWITKKEQALNKRDTIFIEIDGEYKILAEWCRVYGVAYYSVWIPFRKGTPLKEVLERARLRKTSKGVATIN